MSDRQKRSQRLRFLFAAGVSGIVLAVCGGHAAGQTSEIDSYDAAVTSQSKAEALSFIRTFGSSHLVGDLIGSLPPEVAQQVCAELQGDGPARARKACEVIREAFAVQPVLPAAEIAPAAGSAAVDPVSTGADTSAGVSSEDEPAAGSAAVDPVSTGADTSAGVSPEDEPAAGSPVVDPVSIGADTSAGASSEDEPAGEQDAGDTDTAGDTNLFYLPVIATAPAAGTPVAEPVSSAASRGGKGNGGTDESDGIILQTARTVPTASTAVPSVSTSTSASKAAPDVDEPDTSHAQSSSGQSSSSQGSNTQSGSAESSSGQGSNAQSGNAQSSSGQSSSGQSSSGQGSNAQSGNAQSGNAQSSSDQSGSGKDKGGKDKGGKDKGGKGKGGADKGSG